MRQTEAPDEVTRIERSERRLTPLYRRIVIILNIGFFSAVGLMLAGIVVGIARGNHIGESAEPIRDVLPAAARLEAQGLLDLGILVLLVTPVAFVLASLVTFIRQRDALFVGVCMVLLAIIGGSIGMALT